MAEAASKAVALPLSGADEISLSAAADPALTAQSVALLQRNLQMTAELGQTLLEENAQREEEIVRQREETRQLEARVAASDAVVRRLTQRNSKMLSSLDEADEEIDVTLRSEGQAHKALVDAAMQRRSLDTQVRVHAGVGGGGRCARVLEKRGCKRECNRVESASCACVHVCVFCHASRVCVYISRAASPSSPLTR